MALESEVGHSRPSQHTFHWHPTDCPSLLLDKTRGTSSRSVSPQVTKHASKFGLWNYHVVFISARQHIPNVLNSVFSGVYPILRVSLHPFKLATHGGVFCYSHAAWWRCVQFVRHTSRFLLVVQMKPLVMVLIGTPEWHETCSFWVLRNSLPSPSKAVYIELPL